MYVGPIRALIGSIQGTSAIFPSDCFAVSIAGDRKRPEPAAPHIGIRLGDIARDFSGRLIVAKPSRENVPSARSDVGSNASERAQGVLRCAPFFEEVECSAPRKAKPS